MGRCWTILEGGNRGDVLRRPAIAKSYGDLNDRGDACGGDRDSGVSGHCSVERDVGEKVYAVLTVERFIRARFSTRGHGRPCRH